MNAEILELVQRIRKADAAGCIELLGTFKNNQISALRIPGLETTGSILAEEEVDESMWEPTGPRSKSLKPFYRQRRATASLVLMAVARLPDVMELYNRGARPWDTTEGNSGLIRLLKVSRPKWINQWVRRMLILGEWEHIYPLVEEGLASPENREEYVYGMVFAGRTRAADLASRHEEIVQKLVYELFNYEGSSSTSLETVDRQTKRPEQKWRYLLIKWIEEGKLDRNRIMDGCLSTLGRDLPAFKSLWFKSLLEQLQPTVSEIEKRKPLYCQLLIHGNSSVLQVAIEALNLLNTQGHFHPGEVVPMLEHLFLSKTQVIVKQAVQWLETLTQPAQIRQALPVCLTGFASEMAPIQSRLMNFIEEHLTQFRTASPEAIEQARAFVVPSLKEQFEQLFPSPKLVQVEVAEPLILPDHDEPARVIPIQNLEELIEQAAYALEHRLDVLEIERVMAGLVHFGNLDDEKKARAIRPLRKKLVQQLATFRHRASYNFISSGTSVELPLCAWALPEFTTDLIPRMKSDFCLTEEGSIEVHAFHALRLGGIAHQLLRRECLPLLGTPSDSQFWIAPEILIRRSLEWQAAGVQPVVFEQVVSILRLKTDASFQLSSTQALEGEWGAVVRYALGDDEPVGGSAPLWIAAARVRYPNADDPQVLNRFPDAGPGGGSVAKYQWKVTREWRESMGPAGGNATGWNHPLIRELSPAAPPQIPYSHFTVLISSQDSTHAPDWDILWNYSYWPTGVETLYAAGVLCLGRHIDKTSIYDESHVKWLTHLADYKEQFRENARLLLNLGLACPFHSGRTAAVQALIQGLKSGRLDTVQLGRSMHPLFQSGCIRPNRLRESLNELLRAEPKSGGPVILYLTELFKGDASQAPDQTISLLELFHELLAEHKSVIQSEETLTFFKALLTNKATGNLEKRTLLLKGMLGNVKYKTRTAAELLQQPHMIELKRRRDEEDKRLLDHYNKSAIPIVKDLKLHNIELGEDFMAIPFRGLWNYPDIANQVFCKHFSGSNYPEVVRMKMVLWWELLAPPISDEVVRVLVDELIQGGTAPGLSFFSQKIAAIIADSAGEKYMSEIVGCVKNPEYKVNRAMLMYYLRRFPNNPTATYCLKEAIKDPLLKQDAKKARKGEESVGTHSRKNRWEQLKIKDW